MSEGLTVGVGEAVEGVVAGAAAVVVAEGLEAALSPPPPEQPAAASTAATITAARTRLCAVVIPLSPRLPDGQSCSQVKLPVGHDGKLTFRGVRSGRRV